LDEVINHKEQTPKENNMYRAVILLMLASMGVIGCQKQANQNAKPQAVTSTIELKTIKCDMCVKTITRALEKVDGVQTVDVSLGRKVVNVDYDDSHIKLSALESVIAEAGYDANSTKRNDVAYQQLPECCR
jgi:periplasmic mercuric ion binding protein